MSDELKKNSKNEPHRRFLFNQEFRKWYVKGNSRSEIFVNLYTAFCEVNIFSGNCGKCCSIRHWKLPENEMQEMQEIFGRMENAHSV